MDTKSLIKKLPNFSELIKTIEELYSTKNIVFSNELITNFHENNVLVFLCRYRETENKNIPSVIEKVIDNDVVNAYSNSYLESIATDNKLFLSYIGEQKQGFCLAVLEKTTAIKNEDNQKIEIDTNDIQSIDNELVDLEDVFQLIDDSN